MDGLFPLPRTHPRILPPVTQPGTRDCRRTWATCSAPVVPGLWPFPETAPGGMYSSLQTLQVLPAKRLLGQCGALTLGPRLQRAQPGTPPPPQLFSGNQAPTTSREQCPCFPTEVLPTLQVPQPSMDSSLSCSMAKGSLQPSEILGPHVGQGTILPSVPTQCQRQEESKGLLSLKSWDLAAFT